MTRAYKAQSTDIEWVSVSVQRPCPICGNALSCHVQSGAPFAACIKQPSDWPLTSGAWLHRIPLPPPTSLNREVRLSGHFNPETLALSKDAAVRSVSTAS